MNDTDDILRKIKEFQTNLTAYQEQSRRFDKEFKDLNDLITDKKNERKELEGEIKQIEDELSKKNKVKSELENEIANAEKQYRLKSVEVKNIKPKRERMERELDDLQKKLEKLTHNR